MTLQHLPKLLFLAAALSVFAGCSLALDFTECTSNEDCATLGAGLVCTNNQCVSGDNTDATTDVEEEVSTVCTLNSECHARFDLNYACMDGECTDIRSEDCQEVIWPNDPDNVVFLGTLLPLTGTLAAFGGIPIVQALTLGIEDINTAGLPGGRRVAIISCDSQAVPEVGLRGARHLVDNINVPVLIGPLISNGFIDVVNQVTKPAGVFTISPSASAPSISSLNDDNLAWRIIASDVYQGAAIVDRVKELDAKTVGVYIKDDSYGNGLFGVIGEPLSAHLGTDNVRFINYQDPNGLEPGPALDAITSAVGSMQTWNPTPDLIVVLGTGEAIEILYQHYSALAQANIDIAEPIMTLVSHGGVPVLPTFFDRDAPPLGFNNFEDFELRLEGTSSNIAGDGFFPFQLRFNARFPGEQFVTASVFGMDAIMVVGLVMCGLDPSTPVTGAALADNIAKIVDKSGTKSTWSASFFATACNNLAAGKNIDYNGVTGPLDFDLETGEIRSDVIGWDVIKNNQGVFTIDAARLYILDDAPATTGTWSCGSTVCAPGAICIGGECTCGDSVCSITDGDSCNFATSACTCGGNACADGATCNAGSCACGSATCSTEQGDACTAASNSCTCGGNAACTGTSGDQCASGTDPTACD